MKKCLLILFTLTICANIYAQESDTIAPAKYNEVEEYSIAEDESDRNIDSLLSIFYIQNTQNIDTTNYIESNQYLPTAELSDDIYIERLSRIASVVHLPYNDIVRRCIVLYTQRNRTKTEEILSLCDYYFPIFEEILDSYGLPHELKTMAVIESALNPLAVSRMRATGPWQFMFRTAKAYGLNVTSYVDERCDPVASCHAAAKYLRDMYAIFGDWSLAIAAYNCGAGNVSKAIRRAGGKNDFWSIYAYLPRETRTYVPLFIGATYALNYYGEHGLKKASATLPYATDTIQINKMLHFEQIAAKTNISVAELRALNPQYRRDIIPGKEKTYTLVLPHEYVAQFIDNENEIYTYNDSVYFDPRKVASPAEYTASVHGGGKKIVHVVRKGDTIGGIAQKYRVSQRNLKDWNNIGSRNMIRIGQKLVIYKG